MISTVRSTVSCALLCGASVLAAASAQAQVVDPTATVAQPGEIVVTATRRAESEKDVPVAVTAIGGEKLAVLNSSGLDIRFLSSRTPSLQVESSFGRTQPRFYIRGLGNTDFDPNAQQPVSVVYDDIALESAFLKAMPVFDVQNVEVLRGPQGTLFGRNTPAGVVKIDSVKPGDTFGGYLSGSWATYNTVNVEGAIGGPVGDGLSVRASGLLQRRDNWVTNDATTGNAPRHLEGYRDAAARFQIAYKSGDFHALLNFHARDLDGQPRLFRAGLFVPGSNHFQPGFSPSHVSQDGVSDQQMHQNGLDLHLDYHFEGLGTLYSITGYERGYVRSIGDIDGGDAYTFANPCSAGSAALNVGCFPDNTGDIVKPKEFSQEVRFASDSFGGFRIQGGAYYFHQDLDYQELDFDALGAQDGDVFHVNRNQNYGIFASGEYKLGDKLTLRAGVRYSHDKKRDIVDGDTPGITGGLPLPITTRAKGSDVTWDGSATYALTRQVNLYTRVATGYQGPAIQDRVTFGSVPSVAKKQTTISAEGGVKMESLDHRLHFDLDGYWWRTKNLQLTAVGGQANSAALINANHAVGYGVEAQLELQPLTNLQLTAGGSWNYTQIRDPNVAVGACGGGCTMIDPTFVLNGATFAQINGNPLPQAPRYIANVTARYSVPLANGDQVYFFTDWSYRSRINYFLYDAEEFRGRSLTEGGMKLGYKTHNNLEAAVFVRNVLNQIRSISAIDFNNLTGMINDPRTIGGEVKISF